MSQRGSITLANSAVIVVEANARRESIIIVNNGPFDVYIGADENVTAGTGSNAGIKLVVEGILTEDSGGTRMYMGDFWAISDTATASSVSYWERLI